jgi:hypothetical protein
MTDSAIMPETTSTYKTMAVHNSSFDQSDPILDEKVDGRASDSIDDVNEARFLKISRLHLGAFFLFLLQTLIYSTIKVDTAVNPSVGFATDCNGPICQPSLKKLGNTNPTFLIPLFCALACVDHGASWTYGYLYPESAKYWLFVVGSNPFRWIEYSMSASFMACAISILSGISDVHLWFLIFVMHAIGMFLGQVIELIPKTEIDPSSNIVVPMSFSSLKKWIYTLSAISIFTPWLVMFCYFFTSVSNSADGVPDFVYVAFLGTFVLFATFGVNSLCHNILGYYDFPTAEIVYIVLSFTAKTFLAGDVFGGLRAGEDNDDGQR